MKQLTIILIISIIGILNINAQELIPFMEKKRLGFKDENGKVVVPPKYTFTFDIDRNGFCDFDENGLCKVNIGGKTKKGFYIKGGKWGYINREGKEIIPLIYDDLEGCVNDSIYIVRTKKKFGYVNRTGRIITPVKYNSIKPTYNGFSFVYYDKKYGVINDQGIEIIPAKYDRINYEINYGLFWCNKNKKKKNKVQLIDATGKLLTQQIFHAVHSFNNGYAAVMTDKYWGFIDTTGKTIIPNKYSEVGDFNNGFAIVNIGGKPGNTFCENFFVTSDTKGGKWGFINNKGKEISSIKYDAVYDFSDDMAIVCINNKFGYINSKGEEVIPMIYDAAGYFINGFACVNSNGKLSVINKKRKTITKKEYDNIALSPASKKIISVNKNTKWGFIDTLGNELIPPKYTMVGYFNNGMVFVNNLGNIVNGENIVGGLFGYFDSDGKEITDIKYSDISNFNEFGLSWAKIGGIPNQIEFDNKYIYFVFDGKYVLVDTTGKEITPVKYDYVTDFNEGISAVSYKGKCGFVDKTGKEITPIKYDYVSNFKNGRAWTNIGGNLIDGKVIGGSFIQINYKGEEIVPESEFEDADFELNNIIKVLNKEANFTIVDVVPNIIWGF